MTASLKPPFPNPDCRHPDRYSSPDNIATEHQVTALVAAFVTALQPDYVVETGTYQGHTAQAIAEALQANGRGHLDTIEANETRAREATATLAGLPATVHHTSSLHFHPTREIDFAWFDSAPNDRAPEFKHYRGWMYHGTIVGFHDTSARHKVRPKVEALASEGLVRVIFLPTWRGVAFAEVL